MSCSPQATSCRCARPPNWSPAAPTSPSSWAAARLERGAEDEALEAVESHVGDFAAEGIAARIRLAREGIGKEAFAALDRGERDAALDGLLDELATAAREPAADGAPEDIRELLRRAIVGILSELDPADPSARDYRRKLAAALG